MSSDGKFPQKEYYESLVDKSYRFAYNLLSVKDGLKFWTTPITKDTPDKALFLAKVGAAHGCIRYANDYWYEHNRALSYKFYRCVPPSIAAALMFGAGLYSYEVVTGKKSEAPVHMASAALAMTFLCKCRQYVKMDRFQPSRVFVATAAAGIIYLFVNIQTESDKKNYELTTAFKRKYAFTYTTGYTTSPLKNIDPENEKRGFEI